MEIFGARSSVCCNSALWCTIVFEKKEGRNGSEIEIEIEKEKEK